MFVSFQADVICLFMITYSVMILLYFTHRCANTGLGDVVSELLSALLNRLTELEQHEKELRACQSLVDEVCVYQTRTNYSIYSYIPNLLFFALYKRRLNLCILW